MLLRLAYLGITNAFALLRLLPRSMEDKDAEILALRHQLTVLQRQLDGRPAAPAGVAVDATAPPQHARLLGPFRPPHGKFRADAERAAAAHLLDAGIAPGTRRGVDARDLESRQIYPVLLDLFKTATAPFAPEAIVQSALEDLERVHLGRWRDEGHLGRLIALASPGVDITSRTVEARRESNVAARSLALVVEEILREPVIWQPSSPLRRPSADLRGRVSLVRVRHAKRDDPSRRLRHRTGDHR